MSALLALLLAQAAPVTSEQPVIWDCIRVGMTEKEAEAACGKKHYGDARYHYTATFLYENKGKQVSSLTLRSFDTTGATMIAGLEGRFGKATSVERVARDMLEGRGLGSNVAEGQLFTWRLPYMTVEYLQPGDGRSGQVRYTVVDTARTDLTF